MTPLLHHHITWDHHGGETPTPGANAVLIETTKVKTAMAPEVHKSGLEEVHDCVESHCLKPKGIESTNIILRINVQWTLELAKKVAEVVL